MALATLTTKGQVTIPKAIRESLKINSSDKINGCETVLTFDKKASKFKLFELIN